MNVLVLYAHPVDNSFCAAIHRSVLSELHACGHSVDNCDLNLERFNPVMSAQDRIDYHSYPTNIANVQRYVDRLLQADAIVIVTPIWNFGFPAILKGYFDKVWAPGVVFDLAEGDIRYTLDRLKTVVTIATYGATPLRAFLAGDPPRKFGTRVMRAYVGMSGRIRYLAHYAMDKSTPLSRTRFIEKANKVIRSL